MFLILPTSQDPGRYSTPEYLFCNYFAGQFMAKSGRDGSPTLDNSWSINVVLDFIQLWLCKTCDSFFANLTNNSILIATLLSCSSFCRPVRIQADIPLLNIYFVGQSMASQDPVRYSAPEYLFCNYFAGQFMAKSGRDGSSTLDNI